VTVGRRRVEQRRRVLVAALQARQSLVELDRAGLLEGVDHRLRIAAYREPRPGRTERGRRPDAVSEVTLGRRAEADGRAGLAEQLPVAVARVGDVDRGEALRERAGVGEQLGRRLPICGLAGNVLGG